MISTRGIVRHRRMPRPTPRSSALRHLPGPIGANSLNVLAKLHQRNVSLHMIDLGGDVTGNGISKLVFTILSAVAEAERDRIRERIADVKQDQKTRGRYLVAL